MKGSRAALLAVGLAWALSWVFARDLVRGLEAIGVLPRRGLVFSDASDFAFSLVVLALLLGGWALVRVLLALGGRLQPPAATLEDDPRYRELLREKEQLLRDLKEISFDRDLRKISEEDYAAVEARLRREATQILRALDELDPVRLYGERIRKDLARHLGEPAEETRRVG